MLTAKILTVTAQDLPNGSEKPPTPYQFKVYEFSNGAIMVPSDTTNDWFFDSRENIEPNGLAEILAVEETDETKEFTSTELREALESSIHEFGESDGTKEIASLLMAEITSRIDSMRGYSERIEQLSESFASVATEVRQLQQALFLERQVTEE